MKDLRLMALNPDHCSLNLKSDPRFFDYKEKFINRLERDIQYSPQKSGSREELSVRNKDLGNSMKIGGNISNPNKINNNGNNGTYGNVINTNQGEKNFSNSMKIVNSDVLNNPRNSNINYISNNNPNRNNYNTMEQNEDIEKLTLVNQAYQNPNINPNKNLNINSNTHSNPIPNIMNHVNPNYPNFPNYASTPNNNNSNNFLNNNRNNYNPYLDNINSHNEFEPNIYSPNINIGKSQDLRKQFDIQYTNNNNNDNNNNQNYFSNNSNPLVRSLSHSNSSDKLLLSAINKKTNFGRKKISLYNDNESYQHKADVNDYLNGLNSQVLSLLNCHY